VTNINYSDLEQYFLAYDYKWTISGKLQSPTAEDIEQTITAAVQVLSAEDDTNSSPQIEIGQFIIQHNRGHYDVYLRVGETTLTKET